MTTSFRAATWAATTPAVIVPVAHADLETCLTQVHEAIRAGADLIEWRVDYALASLDAADLRRGAARIREACGSLPLLMTLRTRAEGGKADVRPVRYLDLCQLLVHAGADLIDVELTQQLAHEVVEAAHRHGVGVVGSVHDWDGALSADEQTAALTHLHDLDVDVIKVACATPTRAAALAYLGALERYTARPDARPLIAAGIGAQGPLARILAPLYGVAAVFASGPTPTAPGQIDCARLRTAWSLLGFRPDRDDPAQEAAEAE